MEDKKVESMPKSADLAPVKTINIQISALTVVKVVLVLVGLFLVWRLREVIIMLFIALILSSLIDPFADYLAKRRMPRAAAVLAIYILLFGLVGTALVLIFPPLLGELSELAKNFSGIWQKVAGSITSVREISAQYGVAENIQRGLEGVEAALASAVGSALGTIRGFFGGIVSFVLVLVLTFYMVVEEDAVKRLFRSLAPEEYQPYLAGLFTRMQKKIGSWMRGELILMFIVGLFSYIGLLILGVDYALILGLIAGIAEIIPYAGPVVSAIPAVIIAFTQSPIKALFVLVLYFAIQQMENNLLVPKVMQKAVGLNPIVSIVALLVGARLGGVVGAILAIPIATAASVFIQDLFQEKDAK